MIEALKETAEDSDEMGVFVVAVGCIKTKTSDLTLLLVKVDDGMYSMGLTHAKHENEIVYPTFGRCAAASDKDLIVSARTLISEGKLPSIKSRDEILGWRLEEVLSSKESALDAAQERLESYGFRYLTPNYDKPAGVGDNPFVKES